MDIETLTYAEAKVLLANLPAKQLEIELEFFVEAIETLHEAKFTRSGFFALLPYKHNLSNRSRSLHFGLCRFLHYGYDIVPNEDLSEEMLTEILRKAIVCARQIDAWQG